MSIHVRNIEDFKKLLDEAGNKLVIVDFFAHWCGPCKMIAPKLEELAHEFPEKIIIVKVDVDECEDLAAEYNIASMPTFVYIIASNKLETFTGANYEKVKALALKYI